MKMCMVKSQILVIRKNRRVWNLRIIILMERGNFMPTIMKTLEINNSTLNVISTGKRRRLADFHGTVKIYEEQVYVSVLGQTCKGIKKIHASFILCNDIQYCISDEFHSGKVYEAVGEVQGEHTCERMLFSGLRFEEFDPISGRVTFEVTDLELIQKMLTM